MPRNPTVPLTENERAIVDRFKPLLVAASVREVPVSMQYTKRDGSHGSATGVVQYFSGSESNTSVTLDTTATKGRPTTVNIRLIERMVTVG